MDLPLRVASTDALHIADIGPVHPDEIIEPRVIRLGNSPRVFPVAVNAVPRENPARAGIDRVPELLVARPRRLDIDPTG